jgi:hypothetical protein
MVYALAASLAWMVAVVGAQKVTTPEELDKTMKAVNQANMTVNKSVGSGDFAAAKTAAGVVKQNLTNAMNFWVEKKKDDAINFTKDTIAKIEAFEKAVSASTVDPAAATAAFKEYAGTCRNCHMKYRAQDANGNYMIRPGSIDGVQ